MRECSVFWVFICCLIVSGCARQQSAASFVSKPECVEASPSESDQLSTVDDIRFQEAKLADVAIPLAVHPIPHACAAADSGDVQLSYFSALSNEELINFYMREMELLGWRHVATVAEQEGLLLFGKPEVMCAISIRPSDDEHEKRSRIVIFRANQASYFSE